ncbi:hypothetical protein A0H81_10343 [Grifola frondosa]|uniref:Uncharacterized protein n=1 Tax=Grifola frondosa TaxID=5627 RepID=A0A1C7LYQ0_GRIFR|nr:hypothetical protein A0H81_10343 [Grifola frondosa]
MGRDEEADDEEEKEPSDEQAHLASQTTSTRETTGDDEEKGFSDEQVYLARFVPQAKRGKTVRSIWTSAHRQRRWAGDDEDGRQQKGRVRLSEAVGDEQETRLASPLDLRTFSDRPLSLALATLTDFITLPSLLTRLFLSQRLAHFVSVVSHLHRLPLIVDDDVLRYIPRTVIARLAWYIPHQSRLLLVTHSFAQSHSSFLSSPIFIVSRSSSTTTC